MTADDRLTVTADRELCVGTGACVFSAPDVFAQSDDDGQVVVRDAHPDPSRLAAVRESVTYCPVSALRLQADAEVTVR